MKNVSVDFKHQAFFENAKQLNEKFNIIPLMYGSLGLEYLTKQSLGADDVDVLVPKLFVTSAFDEFRTFLSEKGYVLVDEREHTFVKEGISFSFAQIEELETFAQIRPDQIKTVTDGGAVFKLLSIEQYLKVYSASIKDGYRIEVRGKKDAEKIEFIKNLMKTE